MNKKELVKIYGMLINPNESLIDSHQQMPCVHATLILFRDIQNSSSIKKALMKGEIEAALIKPSMILDTFQVEVATQKAVRNQSNGRMKTRSIYAEIIYNLSSSKKISEAFKVFGFEEKNCEALAVVLDLPNSDKVLNLKEKILGNVIDIQEIKHFSNENVIRNHYKIGEEEPYDGSLLNSIICRMACNDFPII